MTIKAIWQRGTDLLFWFSIQHHVRASYRGGRIRSARSTPSPALRWNADYRSVEHRRYTVVFPKMLFNAFVIFCAVQLAVGKKIINQWCIYIILYPTGQTFTSVPANGIIVAGENITVTCDSGQQGLQPAVTTTNDGVVIENITPQGTGSQIRMFRASAFTRNDNGTELTCKDTDNVRLGSIIVIVQCKFRV